MDPEQELKTELKNRGANFIHFVDISGLPVQQNKYFPVAVLIGITLSPEYLREITKTKDYVKNMIQNKRIHLDEFHLKEKQTDALADFAAQFIVSKGFAAYSQSEDNIYLTGYYDLTDNRTPLPHKTIALMAGLGWIGKHNLLVTQEFGSAISMCTVLTDAPFKTILHPQPKSRCGNCQVCVNVCTNRALKGINREPGMEREEIIDVKKCTPCIKCLVFCPWTQKYIKRELTDTK